MAKVFLASWYFTIWNCSRFSLLPCSCSSALVWIKSFICQCDVLDSSSINVLCQLMHNCRYLFHKEWITASLISSAFLVNQINIFTSDRFPRHLFCLSSFVIRHWCRLCSTVLLLLWGLLVDLRFQPVPNTTLLRSVNVTKQHSLIKVVLWLRSFGTWLLTRLQNIPQILEPKEYTMFSCRTCQRESITWARLKGWNRADVPIAFK